MPIDDINVCFHDDADDCACRKPKPGMLLEAAAEPDRPRGELSWSATVGATSTPAARPAADHLRSTTATMREPDACPTGSCRVAAGGGGLDPRSRANGERDDLRASTLKIKIFADGADIEGMRERCQSARSRASPPIRR